MSALKFNLVDSCGDNVTPGIESKIYAACACDVDVFPPVVGTTTQGDSITLQGDITLLAGKQFFEIDVITDTGEVKHTLVGQKKSRSYRQSLMAKTTGNKNYDEFFNNNRNGCFIFLFKDKDGNMRVIGHPTKGYATFATAEDTSGSNEESAKEWTFEATAAPGNVAYYYNGVIDVTP